MVIARELGVPAHDARLRRGVKWIRANQRESGKWFTQSPVNDAGNLISNVGSAYVILTLQACDELPGWSFSPTKPVSRPKLRAAPLNTTGETDHRFHKKNSDGWFRVDLRKGWIDRAEVLFIKPKP